MNNIPQRKQFKVLLLGDICTDIYKFGHVERISPEAPVPLIVLVSEESKLGMAANVKTNLEALDCSVDLITGQHSSIKTRIIDSKSKQHILRIDDDRISQAISAVDLPKDLNSYDAILISDYCKGSISYTLVLHILENYLGPVFIDTKKSDLKIFERAFVKVNEHEYSKLTSVPTDLIVTLGEAGVLYKNKKYPAPKVEVKDVCGAGDTFMAALVYAYCKYGNIEEAISFAVRAGAISVQHLGVYAPKLQELE